MDKQQAREIVRTTLEHPFDKDKFVRLTKNLLNNIEPKQFHIKGVYVPETFREYVTSYERIGTYTDPEDKKVDLLIVYLQRESSVERARTAQRNFIARYLKDRGEKDAGLVAFVSPNAEDWRFSFVKMDYKFEETPKGTVKVKEEFTPAKRYSFLVGKNENSHTAQSRLVPLLLKDEQNPKLCDIEDIFSVEKATKEFFEKYRELYLRAHDTLEGLLSKDKALRADFKEKNVGTADFCKKLLGQIVFLYFLQRKGWFGVPLHKSWGEGDKRFLRSCFEHARKEKKNYFNDFLEPLFYEALGREREDDYYSRFNCRIPFLNGGLFDPICNYDWINTAIDLPDDLFSNNNPTREGDRGDGILDVFDRFNFTVREDEPLEKEVAVDPEMLGKVFENLLEVKDRKSKGTYYTPREIVHYMCVQSLINHLATELDGKVSKEDLEQLVKYGDLVGENEARVEKKGEETDTYYYKLPESIREHSKAIDEKLADIKVCDPAIGSGAFPVGMMTEIVRTRNVLSAYITDSKRTIYNLKRHCIQNSLYGVDIDPGAIEIAKLRLWLSLIVDEEDIKKIKPLPNLDYKIMQGNSLLEEYEGIKLFDEHLLAATNETEDRITEIRNRQDRLDKEMGEQHRQGKLTKQKKKELLNEYERLNKTLKQISSSSINDNDKNVDWLKDASIRKQKADKLKQLHEAFFDTIHKKDKDAIKKEIDALEWELIEATLKEQGKTTELVKLEEFKRSNTKPFFLWKLNFSEVFQENGGFDVVIANPPYVDGCGLTVHELKMLKQIYKSAQGKINLFNIFQEQSWLILGELGISTFIIPSPFLRNSRYWAIRKFLLENSKIVEIVTFVERQFESAVVESILIFVQKIIPNNNSIVIYTNLDGMLPKHLQQKTFYDGAEYKLLISGSKLDSDLISKIRSKTVPLGDIYHVKDGISTGFKPFPEILLGKVNENKFVSLNGQSEKYDPEIHKKVIDGGEFNKFSKINWKGRYIKYDKTIEYDPKPSQGRPFNCQLREKDIFEQSVKLISRQTSNRLILTIDYDKYYTRNSVHNIFPINGTFVDVKYVLGVLNSSLLNYVYKKSTQEVGKVHPQVHISDLKKLPIIVADTSDYDSIINIVDDIMLATGSDDYAASEANQARVSKYEKQIDQLVYKLYGLTDAEIEIVEESCPHKCT